MQFDWIVVKWLFNLFTNAKANWKQVEMPDRNNTWWLTSCYSVGLIVFALLFFFFLCVCWEMWQQISRMTNWNTPGESLNMTSGIVKVERCFLTSTLRGICLHWQLRTKCSSSTTTLFFSSIADVIPQQQQVAAAAGLATGQSQQQLQQQQAPRFTTHPSSSGSIVSEGRTKILQCHALGKLKPTISLVKFAT